MTVTVLIPLKALSLAKGRLAPALEPADRRDLVAWMAGVVVRACSRCPAVAEVIVVAGDADAAEVGRAAGASVLLVAEPGLQRALDIADAATADRPATLVVAADLPALVTDDIRAVVDAGHSPRGVVIAPTHDGGTGALLRRPPGVMATAYGPGSAAGHAALASAAGLRAVVVSRPGLSLDVDRPEQLPPALARRRREAVGSDAPNPHRNEESACRKAP